MRHGRRVVDAVLIDLDGVTAFDATASGGLRGVRERARRGGFDLFLTGCGGRTALLPLRVQQMLTEHRTFPTAEAAVAAHAPEEVAVGFPEPRTPVEPRVAVPV